MLKRDVTITFIGQALSVVFSIGIAVVLARALGPDGRGLLALAVLIPSTVATFARLGQESVNSTFAGLYPRQRPALFAQTLLFVFFGGILCVLIGFAFFYWLPIPLGRFSQLTDSVILTGFLFGPSMIFGILVISLVRGMGRIKAASVLQVFQAMVTFVLGIIFLVLLRGGVESGILAMSLGPVLAGLAGIWVIRSEIGLPQLTFDYGLFKKSLRFGFAVGLATFAGFMVYRLDQGILAYFVNEAEVGWYVVAVGLAERLRILPNSVSTAFLPRLTSDLENRQKQVPLVFRCTMIISVISMLIVGIVGIPAIMLLFGTEYVGSIQPFLILLPGVAALGASSVLASDILAREKPRYSTIVGWSMLALCVVLNLILIPLMGIAGAAVTSSITYFIALGMWLTFYRLESGRPLSEMIPRKSDVLLIATLVSGMLRSTMARAQGKTTDSSSTTENRDDT